MTVKEGTICSLIQSFPVFLILAQNAQKCLKTPLMYKPPSPTQSPEYYEALDALFQSLYGHGYHGNQASDHGYPVYQTPGVASCQYSYGYGKKWSSSPSYGGSKPCYQYVYTTGNNYHTYGSGLQGYPSYGAYGLKKGNIYSLSGNISSTGYAPTQVYNTKNRYQVVVKKTRTGGRKKSKKLVGGFFPQRENRRNGFLGQGFLQGSRRIKDRFQGFFNAQPNRPAVINPEYNNYNGQDFGRPVSFPTNSPVYYENEQNNGNVNFDQPSYDNGQVYTQDQPAQGGGGDSGYQDEGNVRPSEEPGVPEENDPVNFDDTPREPQDSTTLPPLTPLPVVNTESRNSFNFQQNEGPFSDPCQTVDGGAGNCITVYECQPYLAVLQESRTNPNAVQLLRQAHCGFEGNAPKVCCPLPGIPDTPAPPPPTPAPPPPTPAPTPPPTEAPTQPAPTAGPKTDSGDFLAELPEPPVCGSSNATFSRVVGGVPAKLGDFPWMALLGYMSKRTGTTNWLCGGSLISSRHVLTAAHCIHNHETDLYVVRLGELDLAREDEGATPVDVLIKKKIKHAQYSATAFTDDIGILVLDHDVTFSDLIRPICIPRDTQLRSNTFEDYNPMIAGWGHTEFRGPAATHLQVLQLPVVSNDYCTQAYSAYKVQKIDGRVLCAGFKQGGKDACQGDSGGPLMQPIWNQVTLKTFFYQIGVVSYGKKCAEANFPGVYSRVTHFVPWIEEQVLGYSSST